MPFIAYKVLHHAGILALFLSLGGLVALRLAPGAASAGVARLLRIIHGVALVVILVAGFGLLAKMGLVSAWPLWITLKLLVWLALGAAPALLRGSATVARGLLVATVLLGSAAAWVALVKP